MRERLTLLILAVLTAVVVGVGVVTDAAFGAFQRGQLAQLALGDLARIDAMLRSGTPGDPFLQRAGTRLQFVAIDGSVMLPNAERVALPAPPEPAVVRDPVPELEGPWMLARIPWVTPSGVEAGTIRLALPMDEATAARAALRRTLAATGALALAFGAMVAVTVLRRAMRPLERLATEARAVDPADPALVRYAGPSDEVGAVADALARAVDGIRAHRDAERERLADVAHELAAPLTVVTNHLRTLARHLATGASSADRERLQAAEAAAAELHASAEDLMAVARGDLNERLAWAIVDLAELARRVAAAYPGVRVEAGAGDLRALVDPVRMRQALRNLVRNAVRAAGRPEGVDVRVNADASSVRVEVEDDGPGLSDAARDAIFGRYVSGAGSAGLGLAVVRRLVDAMGGTIDVRSEPGAGATFRVLLPGAEAALSDEVDAGA